MTLAQNQMAAGKNYNDDYMYAYNFLQASRFVDQLIFLRQKDPELFYHNCYYLAI